MYYSHRQGLLYCHVVLVGIVFWLFSSLFSSLEFATKHSYAAKLCLCWKICFQRAPILERACSDWWSTLNNWGRGLFHKSKKRSEFFQTTEAHSVSSYCWVRVLTELSTTPSTCYSSGSQNYPPIEWVARRPKLTRSESTKLHIFAGHFSSTPYQAKSSFSLPKWAIWTQL